MDIKVISSPEEVVSYCSDLIQSHLDKNESVLWLVSGGSAIQVEVAIQKRLRNYEALNIMLIDERYGDIGHPDSNWQQLATAGLNLSDVKASPVLTGDTFERTVTAYDWAIASALQQSDFVVGLFGMGGDGHTAGILPNSPLVNETIKLVDGYQAADYLRITATPAIFPHINHAVLYAAGDAKREQLERLLSSEIDGPDQPAQFLKDSEELTIFTDQEGLQL